MPCKGSFKVSSSLQPIFSAVRTYEFLQFILQVSVSVENIGNAISRGFRKCGVNRTTHNRSKVRIYPAFCTLGPRLDEEYECLAAVAELAVQFIMISLCSSIFTLRHSLSVHI